MVKKFWLAVFFCCAAALAASSAEAQQIVQLPQIGPARAARSIPWSSTSGSGIGIIWAPTSTASYVCLGITNNNPTNLHGVSIFVFVTADQTGIISQTFGTTNNRLIQIYNGATSANMIPTNSTGALSLPISGAAQVAVLLNGGSSLAGTPDTFDFLETDSPIPCNPTLSGVVTTNGIGVIPRPCGLTFQGAAATGTQVVISAAPTVTNGTFPLSPRWHICSYVISGAAATASATNTIQIGSTPAACAAATTGLNSWAITVPVGVPNYTAVGNPEVFSLAGVNALCYKDGGTTTGTTITINYDYW